MVVRPLTMPVTSGTGTSTASDQSTPGMGAKAQYLFDAPVGNNIHRAV